MVDDRSSKLRRRSNGTLELDVSMFSPGTWRALRGAAWIGFAIGGALVGVNEGLALIVVWVCGFVVVLSGLPGGGRKLGRLLIVLHGQLRIHPPGSKSSLGGYRSAADEGELEVDGRRFPFSVLREVVVATYESTGRQGTTQICHAVSIIAESRVIEVSIEFDPESASALARELSESLGLEWRLRSWTPISESDWLMIVVVLAQIAVCGAAGLCTLFAPFALAAVGVGVGAALGLWASSRWLAHWLRRSGNTDASLQDYYQLESPAAHADHGDET